MASILLIDQLVRLDGLQNEALNGSIGIVTRNQELDSTGRYSIQLKSPPSAIISYPLPIKIQAKNLVLIHECARHGCDEIGKSNCLGCGAEFYCSRQCQEDDWKIHKMLCVFMKDGDRQLSFSEVENKVDKLTKQAEDWKKGKDGLIRILQYRLSFADHHYGNRISGKSYRKKGNVTKSNWDVEIDLYWFCNDICKAYMKNKGQGEKNVLNKGLYYFQKSLSVLEPWRIQLTLQKSERTETLDEEQSNEIYKYLSITERNLGSEYYNLRNFKKAGECYDRSISYGKEMMVGEERTDFIYEALTKKARGCLPNFDNIGAKAAYEETYELLAATDSYHPKALKNLGLLIPVLIELREFEDAERYARQLYHVLTHPIDTESQEVAETANSLASIIYSLVVDDKLVGDIKEAEMLSRKSIRIMERIQGPDFYMKGPYLHTLSRVLNHTGNEMEVKDLLEQSLVISKRTDLGGDRNLHRESQNVALVSFDLATLHYRLSLKHPPGALRTKQERIAESYRREAVRISTVLHGPTHPKTRFFETYDKKYIDMIASS